MKRNRLEIIKKSITTCEKEENKDNRNKIKIN